MNVRICSKTRKQYWGYLIIIAIIKNKLASYLIIIDKLISVKKEQEFKTALYKGVVFFILFFVAIPPVVTNIPFSSPFLLLNPRYMCFSPFKFSFVFIE